MAAGENQGYLGNLDEKTLPELRELLQRQQSIMTKLQFVAKLHDKGEKIKTFIHKLNHLINQRMENGNDPSQLHSVTFCSEPVAVVNPSAFESLRDKSVCEPHKIDDDDSCVQNTGTVMDIAEDLSKGFQRIAVSSEQDAEKDNESKSTETYINSYNRVIMKADKRIKRPQFKPSSTLKISNIDELPDKFKCKSRFKQQQEMQIQTETSAEDTSEKPAHFLSSHKDVVTMNINNSDYSEVSSRVSGKSRIQEESAVCLPHHQFIAAKMISIEESIKLVADQRKIQEEIQTKHAADRLAARLYIKMDNYNPEGTDMNYRKEEDSDTDSDDEPEQAGYKSDDSS